MAKIDLKELAARESERIEWKEDVADIDGVIRTAVAFANDIANLGGGYIICGAKEGTDEAGFQKVFFQGMTSSRCKEVEGKVLADCLRKVNPPITPLVEEIPTEDPYRRVLVFVVPATVHAHNYRADGKDASTYYIRVGRDTREAKDGMLRELLVRKQELEPWDRRINNNAGLEDVDLLVLRDYLQQMRLWDSKKPLEDYLSYTESLASFIPPLAGKQPMSGAIKPRNFTLLMFGKNPTRLFSGARTIFSIYRGKDRSEPTAERYEIEGTVAQQARRLIELLNAESYTAFDKTKPDPNQVKYPLRALQEAIVNAIVHRDYESDQPARITVFSDRIEINSPGTLPRAVDREKFLKGQASPHWRNQTLAYFFNKLQLAQAEGQGIPTIIQSMAKEGCPPPIFEIESENLVCILPAHPRHELMREFNDIENKIVLGNYVEALSKLEMVLVKDSYNYRALELYCETNNLQKTPINIFNFLHNNHIDVSRINSGTLLLITDTLSAIRDVPEVRALVNVSLSQVKNRRLDEEEAKRVVRNYRRVGKNEEAVALIDKMMHEQPKLAINGTLLEMRGRAKIDLSKACINTAKNPNSGPQIRARAWNFCRTYLADAEKDLVEALRYARNEADKETIREALEFLETWKTIVRRPEQRPDGQRTRRRSRHRGGRAQYRQDDRKPPSTGGSLKWPEPPKH